MMSTSDFEDEDTDPGPDPLERRVLTRDEPSYELIWVEEEGFGMVLRVRRISSN